MLIMIPRETEVVSQPVVSFSNEQLYTYSWEEMADYESKEGEEDKEGESEVFETLSAVAQSAHAMISDRIASQAAQQNDGSVECEHGRTDGMCMDCYVTFVKYKRLLNLLDAIELRQSAIALRQSNSI